MATWFDQPHLLLEMFVNFDMDGKFVSHWNVFTHLVRAMCAIARRASIKTGAWDWKRTATVQPSNALEYLSTESTISVRDVNIQGIEEVAKIAKTLMDATGHAFLSLNDPKFKQEISQHDRHNSMSDYDSHSVSAASTPLSPPEDSQDTGYALRVSKVSHYRLFPQ